METYCISCNKNTVNKIPSVRRTNSYFEDDGTKFI